MEILTDWFLFLEYFEIHGLSGARVLWFVPKLLLDLVP